MSNFVFLRSLFGVGEFRYKRYSIGATKLIGYFTVYVNQLFYT